MNSSTIHIKSDITPYFVGLVLLAIGLTLSPFLMSVAQFFLLAVWLFDGLSLRLSTIRNASLGAKVKEGLRLAGENMRMKMRLFFHNKIAVVLVSLYVLHVIGAFYSSDIQYALKDLRIKLPLLLLPLIFSSMPSLNRRQRDLLLWLYILSVFVATWFSFAKYVRHDYSDVREISRFISHIRFSLQIVFCIFIIGYYCFKRRYKWWIQSLCLLLVFWLFVQFYILESLSSYVVFLALLAVSLLFLFFRVRASAVSRVVMLVLLVVVPAITGLLLYRLIAPMVKVEHVDFEHLEKETALGNPYVHDPDHFPLEDGRYVGLYYCEKEMREAWCHRGTMGYDSVTDLGVSIGATLPRYLTSKGLRKDAQGVAALSDEDIRNVEQGVANYNNWKHPGLRARLSVAIYEINRYRRNHDPNGGSLSQRLEYTKTSLYLIRQHPVFGVGTGDVPDAFRQAYDELQSPLLPQFRHRAHNQYLAITIGFGIVGLILFLFVLSFPYFSSRHNRTCLYTIFLCVILLSMIPEDTIETQAGATFYAFFNALFLLALRPSNGQSSIEKPDKPQTP